MYVFFSNFLTSIFYLDPGVSWIFQAADDHKRLSYFFEYCIH